MTTVGGRRSSPPYKKQTKPHSLRSSGAKSCGLWFLASKKKALVSQFLWQDQQELQLLSVYRREYHLPAEEVYNRVPVFIS